jgi:hypothetical protein
MGSFVICTPPDIRQIKSRRMSWAGHVARMEEGETCTGFWWASPKEKDHLEDQGVDGRMGSKWTLGRLAGGCGTDSPVSGKGSLAGCCDCGDELSGSGATELVKGFYGSYVHHVSFVLQSERSE